MSHTELKHVTYFECPACGRVWHILVRTESGEWERVEAPGSCPGCGARVVVEP